MSQLIILRISNTMNQETRGLKIYIYGSAYIHNSNLTNLRKINSDFVKLCSASLQNHCYPYFTIISKILLPYPFIPPTPKRQLPSSVPTSSPPTFPPRTQARHISLPPTPPKYDDDVSKMRSRTKLAKLKGTVSESLKHQHQTTPWDECWSHDTRTEQLVISFM